MLGEMLLKGLHHCSETSDGRMKGVFLFAAALHCQSLAYERCMSAVD